jgi:hypothetical protein
MGKLVQEREWMADRESMADVVIMWSLVAVMAGVFGISSH